MSAATQSTLFAYKRNTNVVDPYTRRHSTNDIYIHINAWKIRVQQFSSDPSHTQYSSNISKMASQNTLARALTPTFHPYRAILLLFTRGPYMCLVLSR